MPQPEAGPTLTNITFMGRQTVKYGLIAIVLLMTGRLLLNAFIEFWKAANPPPPPPPTMGFGRLPAIEFEDQTLADKPERYVLELASGRLPNFSDRAKVFFMPQAAPSLLDDDRAREIGAELGFPFEPTVIGQTYRFTKPQPLSSTLELDSVTENFTLTTDYLSRPNLIINPDPPSEARAVSIVRSFVSAAGLINRDIATASGEVVYLKSLGTSLEPAVSFSEAEFVKVDINREPIDSVYPFYTTAGTQGVISAILSGGLEGSDSIVEMEFYYQPIDYTQVETYPLRTSQEAWNVLKAGEGYVANPGDGQQAVIREVVLGYYDSFEEQPYMQPIYIFAGDDGFLGYVPALDPRVWGPSGE